ncbi:uncharacterized protein BCR38DRAFT_442438 [Pseudomassariella vexata]|uniref:Uncharacterized protein n=1 Tax=Pseudomassariella vexata TaxID=1141098 RepID=A0A1Y2DNF4_9PEZI|nr:uncharacterized protein BCR38DRAFT_442438 [Pseudomassariella vexata]ORY60767.1 hypothetical protein BCR38DRAFT_442438 [Pseudomassariella vexata]
MPSTDPSFGSNNPFRRKTSNPSPASTISTSSIAANSNADGAFNAPPSTFRPPLTTFKTAASEEDGREKDTPQLAPKKIVKKVRVQSPPPSSPDDVVPVRSYVDDDDDDDNDESSSVDSRRDDDRADPFSAGDATDEPPLPRAPPNPFSKTLQDMEQKTQGPDVHAVVGAGGRGSLDVDSFRRLLLTGYSNVPALTPTIGLAGSIPAHDGASNTDASSVSRQSTFDAMQDTPRTSHEISDLEEPEERRGILPSSPLATVQSASGRKKPPPPSSRHGKLIKMDLGASNTSKSSPAISVDTTLPASLSRKSSQNQSPPSSSDVNKPLPLPPTRTLSQDEIDSPFDREAAGKLPEALSPVTNQPWPLSPPVGSTRPRSDSRSSTRTTNSVRKPAAPPPRRHGRSDSRVPSITGNTTEEDPPRSSLESNRSRSDSLRVNSSSNAGYLAAPPAPPPPRRPSHARQSSSYSSLQAASFTPITKPDASDEAGSPGPMDFAPMEHQNSSTMATVTTTNDGLAKLSPPPPPPARHSSTRRPASLRSMEATSRKVSREKEGGMAPPPPPPPRARGSSRGSIDGPATGGVARRPSAEVKRVEEEHSVPAGEAGGTELLKGIEDLEALKREVEALMGKSTNHEG